MHIRICPLGNYEFAADYRKIGAFCRADVGIGPYPFPEKRIKNLKNQTADQSCGLGFLQRQEPLCTERHADARAFLRRFAGRQRHALLLAA